jgi:hypothetical protein
MHGKEEKEGMVLRQKVLTRSKDVQVKEEVKWEGVQIQEKTEQEDQKIAGSDRKGKTDKKDKDQQQGKKRTTGKTSEPLRSSPDLNAAATRKVGCHTARA